MYSKIAQRSERTTRTRKRIQIALAAAALCLPACPAWAQTTATVTVNAASVSATVPPEGYGLNTYVFDGNMLSTGVPSAVQSSGVTALRYPGGSDSDVFNFISGTEQSMNDGAYWYSDDTFANFMSQLAQPEGGTPVITVNYGSNVTNTGPALPSEAASWVQYANVTNNYGIVYWEIGNETYGAGYYNNWDWEYDLHDLDQTAADRVGNSALSPTAYGTNAAAFVTAMKAVDPTIKCGISVNTSQYSPGWDQGVFQGISAALTGTGLYPDFVIVHWYPSGTNAQILAAQYGTGGIATTVAQIRQDLKNYYTLSNVNDIQILVTETGPGSLTTVGGGIVPFLFASDDYLTWFENGASNVDYQDLHQGYLEEPGDGNEPSGGNDYTTPYGSWYGVSFDSTVARVGDSMVAATSTNPLLRAHAVQRTDGQTGVILINQDPTNSTTVTVNISGAPLALTGTQYFFGNANFSSGSWTPSSGIGEGPIPAVGNLFTVTVSAYTATAILMYPQDAIYFLLSNSGNINVAPGAATGNTSTVTVSPSNGFNGNVAMTCAVNNPAGATSPPTCGLASSSLATGSGTDLLTVTTTSTTTAGTYSVQVTGTSGSLTQFTLVNVYVAVPPSIALTNGSSIVVSPGAGTGNTSTITVTPSGGFTGAVAMTCAITASPSGASDLPTCGLAAPSVTVSGTMAQTDVLTVSTTPATTSLNKPANPFWPSTGGAVLALVFLFGIPARRRKWLSMLGLLVFFVSIAAIGCGSGSGGGGGGGKSNPGTTAGTYSVTVTGTPTSGTAETTVVTLIVN
jgi:hypothetical protein